MASPLMTSRFVTLPNLPELFDDDLLDKLIPPSDGIVDIIPTMETTRPSTNQMMDVLTSTTHRTRTANGAPAYRSTQSSVLDAFNTLSSSSFGSVFDYHLERSWAADPALTLRLIWNLRSVPDGQGEREAFYRAFGWLYKNHPRTAISNLHLLVSPVSYSAKKQKYLPHGYWKDLLNILALATVDELNDISQPATFLHHPRDPFITGKKRWLKVGSVASRIEESRAVDRSRKREAAEARRNTAARNHERLVQKLDEPKFRALYITVARLFSTQLLKDLAVLSETGQSSATSIKSRVSLAAKWAPTPGRSHDRITNIATAISELIHQSHVFPSPSLRSATSSQERAVILRSFYQRWVLTELRRASNITEPLMCSRRWKEIKYSRVPSYCMKNNTPLFFKRDPAGFEAYLTSVEENGASISGATLFPHQLVSQMFALHNRRVFDDATGNVTKNILMRKLREVKTRVIEAQWKSLLSHLKAEGKLDHCLAVCDVSGSMGSLADDYVAPILPAISLSLLLASIAAPPFNGFITFSATPQYVPLDLNAPLQSQIQTMVNGDWGQNTDLAAVFLDLLLPLAREHRVPQDQMIKRLFIFSDMQFDECEAGAYGSMSDASAHPVAWETTHDRIARAYAEAGYEVPQIVYWNLDPHTGAGKTVEVDSGRVGVAMMNGFSPALLKVFMGEDEKDESGKSEDTEWEMMNMDEDGESVAVTTVQDSEPEDPFTPYNVMKKALLRKCYDGLVVFD
ncbi:hypothetical protein D9619_002069 [Psilocybe cf. subviscida]|uniref:Uncharacterized protein n=1 Tax=Psilocybe cf. subviscida TaxID=2480587 RepID=A0A8H5BEZ1_9AGAR|nr:hypothetical protein D9619_002069 [Psilocybe cf. subviscida]